MNLLRKKKLDNNTCCNLNPELNSEVLQKIEASEIFTLNIKILGSGCKKCNKLELATKEALSSLGMKDYIEHVTDFNQIAFYGVMTTPALVINEKVVSYGKVLKKDEIIKLIKKVRG